MKPISSRRHITLLHHQHCSRMQRRVMSPPSPPPARSCARCPRARCSQLPGGVERARRRSFVVLLARSATARSLPCAPEPERLPAFPCFPPRARRRRVSPAIPAASARRVLPRVSHGISAPRTHARFRLAASEAVPRSRCGRWQRLLKNRHGWRLADCRTWP